MSRPSGVDIVGVILAVGVSLTVTLFVVAVTYDSIVTSDAGLSDNATEVLTGTIGGMIGILGGYIGGRSTRRHDKESNDE